MKILAFALSLSAFPLMAETIKMTCPNPQDIQADTIPKIHHTSNQWTGDATISNPRWFFNGTEKVTADKNKNAVLKCNYGNRTNKLSLEMKTSHKASACTQDPCEKITGKGSAKKMIESCTYTCEK